jgi:1,4-dihydroxy-6-naphthoate synthase
MKLLITAATLLESRNIIDSLNLEKETESQYSNKDKSVKLIITGVGIPATIFSLMQIEDINLYDLLINIGIAGCFNKDVKKGSIFNVNSDYFGDTGIIKNDKFKNIFSYSWNDNYAKHFENERIQNTSDYHNFFKHLEQGSGVTVNIPEYQKHDALVETMEGAAFMLFAKIKNKDFIQIRGISNTVGEKDKNNWDLKSPIENYTSIITEFVEKKLMRLKLAISSCPNDTFMFDALVNKKIDTKGYDFDLHIADVEELNKMAFASECDITKISYHAFFKAAENYQLLNSGGALGDNCGPLIVSKKNFCQTDLSNLRIAIPGENTTAKLMMNYFFGEIRNFRPMLFSEIEEAVLRGDCDAGLVIHETRFTYAEKGLNLVADLGQLWEKKLKLPVPLGGIAIKRSIKQEVKQKIEDLLRESIEYAFHKPKSSLEFMKKHAVELSEDIIYKHVNLYVNDFSINLGINGRKAISTLYEKFLELNSNTKTQDDIFV